LNYSQQAAIGVFDSGIGGLTVVSELRRALPQERVIYLGDTARLPYGTKSAETIRRYSAQNADFLLRQGIKLLVVACNSASAWAVQELSESVSVPVLGVIEPGCASAVRNYRGGAIGVIGTAATISSGAYTAAIHALAPNAEVHCQACPLFVPIVEEGLLEGPITDLVIERYLHPLADCRVESLVLGCTHYPLLKPAIGRFMGNGVRLIDSAESVAEAVAERLRSDGLLSQGRSEADKFYLTDQSPSFRRTLAVFLGGEEEPVELVDVHRGADQ